MALDFGALCPGGRPGGSSGLLALPGSEPADGSSPIPAFSVNEYVNKVFLLK